MAWAGVVEMVAAAMGVELDEVREVCKRRGADETFSFPIGTIEQDTMEALRFEVQSIVDGWPAIIVEHVTRLRAHVAPDWPQQHGGGSYVIRIEGRPSLECELNFEGPDGDHNTGGLIATAMRLLNAIPAVCDAPPACSRPSTCRSLTSRNVVR